MNFAAGAVVRFLIALFLTTGTLAISQQSGPATGEKLKFVILISRHGVRSPTGDSSRLNLYSSQPWPEWTVPPGYLTAHGFALMKIFGAYDREFYAGEGLLAPNGCDDAAHIRIIADSDQRTRETARALAEGLAPECPLGFTAAQPGTPDSLFHTTTQDDRRLDKNLAVAAVNGSIGGSPQSLALSYRPQLEMLDSILHGTAADGKNAQTQPHSIFEISPELSPGKNDHLVELRSPLSLASSIVENFLLEYCEGMEKKNVGWGRIDGEKLRELMQLHTAQQELLNRVPYIARAQASKLLEQILKSMEQAQSGKQVSGALSKPDDHLLILVGHDTNLANIAGTLDLHWILDGRRDDTPPGGALVFELWQSPAGYTVRTWFTAQTLDQMRTASPLSLAAPPERVPVFIPSCGNATGDCTWDAFQQSIRGVLAPTATR